MTKYSGTYLEERQETAMEIFRRIEHGDAEHRARLRAELMKWAEEMAL